MKLVSICRTTHNVELIPELVHNMSLYPVELGAQNVVQRFFKCTSMGIVSTL